MKTNITYTEMMKCCDFWNIQEVKDQQDIQKVNPFGSKPHVNAFYEIKRLLAYYTTESFAEQYMGEYE